MWDCYFLSLKPDKSGVNYLAGVTAGVSVAVAATTSVAGVSVAVAVGVSVAFGAHAANIDATANKNNAFFIFFCFNWFDNSFVLTPAKLQKRMTRELKR